MTPALTIRYGAREIRLYEVVGGYVARWGEGPGDGFGVPPAPDVDAALQRAVDRIDRAARRDAKRLPPRAAKET